MRPLFHGAPTVLVAAFLIGQAPAQMLNTTPIQRYGYGDSNSSDINSDGSLVALGGGIGTILWEPATSAVRHVLASGLTFDVDISPSNSFVATASASGEARIWKTTTGASVHMLMDHTGSVRHVRYSPAGNLVATGSDDDTVIIWNAATGSVIHTLGMSADVRGLRFSPDGSRLAAWDHGNVSTARIFSTSTGAVLLNINSPLYPAYDVAISPDNSRVAVVGDYVEGHLYDGATGALISGLQPGPGNLLDQAEFTSDGALVLIGGANENVTSWLASNGNFERIYPGRAPFAISPTSDSVYVQSDLAFPQSQITEAVLSTGAAVVSVAVPDPVSDLRISANGARLLYRQTGEVSDHARVRATVYTVPGLGLFSDFDQLQEASYELYVAPNEAYFLTRPVNSLSLIGWTIGSSDVQFHLYPSQGLQHFAADYSPDSQRIVLAESGFTRVVSASNGGTLLNLGGTSAEMVNAVRYSPNGNQIAVGLLDQFSAPVVRLHDAAGGAVQHTLLGLTAPPVRLLYSPGSTAVAVATSDGNVFLYNTANGALLHTFIGHPSAAVELQFNASGTLLFSADATESVVRVWNTVTGASELPFPNDAAVLDFDISHDGALLSALSSDAMITTYNVTTRVQVTEFPLPMASVSFLEFSPNDARLAIGGSGFSAGMYREGDVVIYNATNGVANEVLRAHNSGASAGKFVAGGNELLTAGQDGLIYRWAVQPLVLTGLRDWERY